MKRLFFCVLLYAVAAHVAPLLVLPVLSRECPLNTQDVDAVARTRNVWIYTEEDGAVQWNDWKPGGRRIGVIVAPRSER